MMTGMTSMRKRVRRVVIPTAIIPAYVRDPINPDAPVPELQVETQLLEIAIVG